MLSAKNKTQNIEECEFDFSGDSYETTDFMDDQNILSENIQKTENLLFDTEKLSAELLHAEGSHELSSVKVTAHILNMELYGLLKIRAYDKKYRFSIRVE